MEIMQQTTAKRSLFSRELFVDLAFKIYMEKKVTGSYNRFFENNLKRTRITRISCMANIKLRIFVEIFEFKRTVTCVTT